MIVVEKGVGREKGWGGVGVIIQGEKFSFFILKQKIFFA